MKQNLLELLPDKTRINVNKDLQQKISNYIDSNRKLCQKLLGVSRTQIYKYVDGGSRLTLSQYRKICKILKIKNGEKEIIDFGLEGSKHEIKIPLELELSEDFIWLLGFHISESSETDWSCGVCNVEFELIKRSLRIIRKIFSIPKRAITLEIRDMDVSSVKESNIKNICKELNVLREKVSVRKPVISKRRLYTWRVNSSIVKILVRSLETKIITGNICLTNSLKGKFLSGLIDADGWLNKKKKIIAIAQVDKRIIDFMCDSLSSMSIRFRREFWEYRNHHVCIILKGRGSENLATAANYLEFFHPIKKFNFESFLAASSSRS